MGEVPQVSLVVLNGVFYEHEGKLMVSDEDLGTVEVEPQLSPLLGTSVNFVAHHCPPDPPDEDRWGGGSCLLEKTGHCHVGHHERPGWLYEIKASGTLNRDEGWWVQSKARLDLSLHFLVGHYGQIVVTALPDLDKLKVEVEQDMQDGSVEALQDRITQLRDMLSQFNKEKDDIDV